MIKTKRVYDDIDKESDGYRVLLMRSPDWRNKAFKEWWKANRDEMHNYMPELSPSEDLLNSYNNGEITWDEFEQRITKEFQHNPHAQVAIRNLYVLSTQKGKTVTLLCQEHEGENCHRHIVKRMVEEYQD